MQSDSWNSRPIDAGDIHRQVKEEKNNAMYYALDTDDMEACVKKEEEGWIKYDGGECPIPHAKAKEYELLYKDGSSSIGHHSAIEMFEVQTKPTYYRMIKIYPPCKGTNCGCTDGFSHSHECVAQINSLVKPIILKSAPLHNGQELNLQWEEGKGYMPTKKKISTKPSDDEIFNTFMASYEAKRKAIRDARSKKAIVPPIGMTAMMFIASKAMED